MSFGEDVAGPFYRDYVRGDDRNTINVTLNSPDATWGNDTKSIGFANINLTGSTFQDAPRSITMTNRGTIAANYVYLNLSALPIGTSPQDAQLVKELNVCIWSPQTAPSDPVLYDGPLDGFNALNSGLGQQIVGSIQPNGGIETYSVEFYAGDVLTKCGQSGAGSLSQEAMGGSVATSIDITYEG